MTDWDAERYHALSDPQLAWGLKVLERLQPRAGEWILDIGCGTGRLTAALREREPSAHVVAVDRSASMMGEARARLEGRVPVAQADGMALPFRPRFDAVFSTATFHWIHDHERLFEEVHRILVPGGRLISQAGGGPNLQRLYDRTRALATDAEFSQYFHEWTDPWFFAGIDETRARAAHAGFTEVEVWLESTPTPFDTGEAYRAFVSTVCLRHQLACLPHTKRDAYLGRLTTLAAADNPPLTLDYWRLNIDARKP